MVFLLLFCSLLLLCSFPGYHVIVLLRAMLFSCNYSIIPMKFLFDAKKGCKSSTFVLHLQWRTSITIYNEVLVKFLYHVTGSIGNQDRLVIMLLLFYVFVSQNSTVDFEVWKLFPFPVNQKCFQIHLWFPCFENTSVIHVVLCSSSFGRNMMTNDKEYDANDKNYVLIGIINGRCGESLQTMVLYKAIVVWTWSFMPISIRRTAHCPSLLKWSTQII